jgi:chromate transporter
MTTEISNPHGEEFVEEKVPPSPWTIFLVFLRIGATSFGGGTSGWMHTEIVERRQWLDEERFFASLTMSQALPGPGPVNNSIYIGLQIAGWAGALAAVTGMVFPAFCIIIGLGVLYSHFGSLPMVQTVLGGLAAVGIGVTTSMGIKRFMRLKDNIPGIGICIAVFVAAGIFHLSILTIVIFALPPSLLLAYLQERRRSNG